jgi:AcrR family transcriptional regulator
VRTDTRERILRSAKSLAEENESLQGVTISLQAAARRAGLTKPGLMYYFPTKEALMVGLVEYAAERWADQLRASTCREATDLSAFDRHRAYVNASMIKDVSRSDYWIFSDAIYHAILAGTWQRHLAPWIATDGVSPQARALLNAARFAADGAWAAEATGVFPAADLDSVRVHTLKLIDQAEELA